MRRFLAVLLAVVALATSFAPLLALTAEAGSPPAPDLAANHGPHHMLPNPEVYPEVPFTEPDGWTGTPPGTRGALGTRAIGTEPVIVIPIEFSDVSSTRTRTDIDAIVSDPGAGAASVHNYYLEASYGLFQFAGTVTNWVTVPLPMSEYGADSSSSQFDDANGPIYRLVVEAVQRANAAVNFANFDADLDGVVDHVIVVHAGDAQEATGRAADIWSHRWSVVDADPSTPGSQPLNADGKQIYGYTMVSEFSPLGVYAHELGHDLGLPDLYDTDGSTDGIGVWDIMSTGSWNGSPRGTSPAHFGAWCKIQLGWITPVVATAPLFGQAIDDAETDPQAFKLPVRTITPGAEEYFLVENRQRTGFDSALPSAGLLIWHVDDSMSGNAVDAHRLVDLEEADGNDRPTQPGDPWESCVDCWGPDSTPNSNSYLNQRTGWKVRNIGASGAVMRADISREVDDDLVVLAVAPQRCCMPTGGTVDVKVTVANRGARTQQSIVVNLTVYLDEYVPATVVCCGKKTVVSLAQGATANLTWNVPDPVAGKYILEAYMPLALDEIPENNVMFNHFNAATYYLFDDVESGAGSWTRNGGGADAHRWEIVQDSTNDTESRSPTHAWRFGRQPGLPPLCPPFCPPPFHTFTSTPVAVPGGPVYVYFWQKYDLRGRGIDQSTGNVETDVAYVNVSIDDGSGPVWRSLATIRNAETDWDVLYADLSPYLFGPATIVLQLSASSDVLLDTGGWWVDDLAVSNTPLTRGLAARVVNPTVVVEPGGVAIFRFRLANVGDFDDNVTFALQPPTGWVAAIGTNQTYMQAWDVYIARLRGGREATLLLGFQVAQDAPRGSRFTVPVTAASASDPSISATFDTVTIINDPFGLAGLEKFVFLFLIVFAAIIVIAVIIDAVKKQKGTYRRW